MEKETIIIDFRVDEKDAIVSIENLTKANKELREERKKLDLQSEEGQARVKEINNQLNRNTEIIKANSSALEKQKMNVGNYTNSIREAVPFLDKMTGGLASAAQGIATMTKQAIAFILTPIGATIAALGLAVAALTAYFKGSEEGQDRLAKITAVLGVAMNKLLVAFEYIGEAVYNAVTGVGSMTDKLGVFGIALDLALTPLKLLYEGLKLIADFSGFTKLVEETIKEGEAIADLYDKIEARENELIVLRAQTSAKVLELREKAIKQEGATKRKTIQEAIDLEKSLAAEEKKNLDDKLKAFDAEAKATGALTEEQKKKRAELVAAIIDAESQGAQATIKFQKEIEKLRDEEQKQKDIALQRDLEAAQFRELISQQEADNLQKKIDAIKLSNEEIVNLNEELNIQLDEERVIFDAKEEEQLQKSIERGRLRAQWTKTTEQQKLAYTSQALGQTSALLQKGSEEYKALATSQALVDTYRAATAALAPPPVGAGPIFGPIFAAVAVATGLANIAKIQGFKQGGYTGDMDTNQVAGVTHGKEFVMPANIVAQYGKEHFQSYMDGTILANSVNTSASQAQAPTVYLSYKEFSDFQNRVKYKEEMTAA